MEINLSSIGIEKGKQYESIISTQNNDKIKNSAPIGIICAGKDTIVCRIFKGSTTLENILSQKEFTVNITKNPKFFTISTLKTLPEEYFADDNSLKDTDAYFTCKVISFKTAFKQSDPIKKSEAVVIKSKVEKIVIKKTVSAMNRSFGYVIESLINFSGTDFADKTASQKYIKEFREAYRIVRKVGYENEIKSMKEIEKELKNKGFRI